MSEDVLALPGKITLIVKGLVAIFINPGATECQLGMIREAPPGHKLEVKIWKYNNQVNPPQYIEFATLGAGLAEQVNLNVANTVQTNIRKHLPDEQINRLSGAGDTRSFRWIVDFETELYQKEIGARRDSFRSFFKFNIGEIFTHKRSINDLQIRRARQSEWIPFGKVAVEVKVEITLDKRESTAILTNGGNVIFQSGPETSYLIHIDRGDESAHTSVSYDADYYFPAVGTKLDLATERVFFKSVTPVNPSPGTPEAACFEGYLSTSQPT
jgi:hypothetical protein